MVKKIVHIISFIFELIQIATITVLLIMLIKCLFILLPHKEWVEYPVYFGAGGIIIRISKKLGLYN